MLGNNSIRNFQMENQVHKNESGAIYVLLAVLLPALFAFMALALDLGIYLVMQTNLQSAADTAVTAAVNHFSRMDTARLTAWGSTPPGKRNHRDINFRYIPHEDPYPATNYSPGYPLTYDQIIEMRRSRLEIDYNNAESAFFAGLLAHAQAGTLKGLNADAINALTSQTAGLGTNGNMTLSFERGIRCYRNADNVRVFCPLGGDPDNWTYANAARMTMSVITEGKWFSKILPGALNPTINIFSWAYVPRQLGGECGAPTCNELGENANFQAGCEPIIPQM